MNTITPRIKVKPREGLTVLDIKGYKIPKKAKGHPVPDVSFYRRLIRDGDLVKIETKKAPTTGEE